MLLARQTIRDASTRVFGEAMIPRDPLTYGIAIRIRKDGANAKHVCSCALLDASGIGRLGWLRLGFNARHQVDQRADQHVIRFFLRTRARRRSATVMTLQNPRAAQPRHNTMAPAKPEG
jgi:hypothetical protein